MFKKLINTNISLFILAAITLLIIGIINLKLTGHRIDLTERKLYTLSSGSIEIIESIDQPIDMEFFYSDSASINNPGIRHYATRVKEILQEFSNQNPQFLRVKVTDPLPFSEDEDRATRAGLLPANLGHNIDPIYLGLELSTQNHRETIAFFHPNKEDQLEHEISKALYLVSQNTERKVALLSSLPVNGGIDYNTQQNTPAWVSISNLQQLMNVENLSHDVEEIPEDIDLLVLIQPHTLSPQTIYAIDQYVMRGKNILLFTDPLAEMAENPSQATDNQSLNALFNSWGIKIQPSQFVTDAVHSQHIAWGDSGQTLRHLGLLALPNNQFKSDNAILKDIESVIFSTAGTVINTQAVENQFSPLIQSSDQSMLFNRNRLLPPATPESLLYEFEPTGETHVLAAQISGKFESAFPQGRPTDASATADLKSAIHNATIILVADTDVLSDRLWVQISPFFNQTITTPFAGNGAFIANAVDTLSGSDALMSIRSRSSFSRPFTVVQALQREAEVRFYDKEQELMLKLDETEKKLAELQQTNENGQISLNDQQQQALLNFQQQKLDIRKSLREVQHQLNKDIDNLGTNIKLFNIFLFPLFIAITAFYFSKRNRA